MHSSHVLHQFFIPFPVAFFLLWMNVVFFQDKLFLLPRETDVLQAVALQVFSHWPMCLLFSSFGSFAWRRVCSPCPLSRSSRMWSGASCLTLGVTGFLRAQLEALSLAQHWFFGSTEFSVLKKRLSDRRNSPCKWIRKVIFFSLAVRQYIWLSHFTSKRTKFLILLSNYSTAHWNGKLLLLVFPLLVAPGTDTPIQMS